MAPEHFTERYGLFIIIIVLGESFIAIGLGLRAAFKLRPGVLTAAALGILAVSALWWLYFDDAAIFARRRLIKSQGVELHRLAMHSYSYLHLPMISGIVLLHSVSRPRSPTLVTGSTSFPRSACAVARRFTCSGISRFFSARHAASSGGEPSGQSSRSSLSRCISLLPALSCARVPMT